MTDWQLREISERSFNYLGCTSNPYLSRRLDGHGIERFYWFGPSGQMYWPLPPRRMVRPE